MIGVHHPVLTILTSGCVLCPEHSGEGEYTHCEPHRARDLQDDEDEAGKAEDILLCGGGGLPGGRRFRPPPHDN